MTAHVTISPEAWDRLRDAYVAGVTAQDLIAHCGVSRSQVYARAREEGWRRADASAAALPDAEPFDPDADAAAPANPADMAEQAWRRCAHALQAGRAGEARAWLRLHRDLRATAREIEAPQVRPDAGAEAVTRLEAARSPAPVPPRPDQTHKTHTLSESGAPRPLGKRAQRRARGRGGG